MGWVARVINKPFLIFLAFLLVFSIVGTSFLQQINVQANTAPSPWLAAEEPSLQNLAENIPFEQLPAYADGGQECIIQQKFISRPAKKIPFQSELSYLSCGVDTPFGTIDKTAKLTRLGTNIAGKMYSPSGVEYKLSPIPNNDTAMHLDFNAPSGAYITMEPNVKSRLSSEYNAITGQVKHFLGSDFAKTVKNEKGGLLYARMDTAGYSSNGNWIIFDAVGIGLTRLNVKTGEILVFAPGYKYDIGLDPSLQLAISSDGRYAVVSSFGYSMYKIYDLDTCVKASAPDEPAACQLRDLKPILQNKIPNHFGIGTKISFTDNYTIKFYGTTLKDNVRTRYVHLLTAAGQTPVAFPYLAMGDSFASGEGAWDYRAGTDVRSPKNKCHISTHSYPYLIGDGLGLNKYESIACSGAKIKDINGQGFTERTYNLSDEGKQSDGLEEEKFDNQIQSNFLPGHRIQKTLAEKHKPNKVTISISGNDMGFGRIVQNCVFWLDNCYSQSSERATLVKTVNDRFDELVTMYGQLKTSSPGADIYAIGYPELIQPNGSCKSNVHVSSVETEFFDELTKYINSVIKKAAEKAGVYFVDVSDALHGYRLCESDGAMAVNGLVGGDDKVADVGPIGNESYHPNVLGHQLLKESILEKTNNFTAKNPFPKAVESPKISDAQSFIESSDFNLLDTNFYNKSDMVDSWWDKSTNLMLNAREFFPNSPVKVTLTSDPVELGSFTANSAGEVNTTLSLPDSVPYGYHTLHVSGKNVVGENIEYQQTVFVTESENDYDGDGISNEQDPCLAIEPSGVDYDQDGIDDACDGEIGEPPVNPPEEVIEIPGNENLPDFESQPDEEDDGAGIIEEVQNQNTSFGQTSGAAGLQQSGVTQPSSAGFQQSGGLVLSSNTSTLNQSGPARTFGSTSASATDTTNKAPLESSSNTPVFVILALIVALIVLAWYLQKRLAEATR